MDNIRLRGHFCLRNQNGDVVFDDHNLVVYGGYDTIAEMVGACAGNEALSNSFLVKVYSGGSNSFTRSDTSISATLQASAGVTGYTLDTTNHSVKLAYSISASAFNGTTTLTTAGLWWGDTLFSEVDLGDLEHEANTAYEGTWEIIFGDDTIPVGDGTEDNPYLIANTTQMDWFRSQVNGGETSIHGALIANITYNQGKDVEGWDGKSANTFTKFTPIAPNSTGYGGVFDGRGNTISGLYVDSGDSPWSGLFGNLASGAVVKDLLIRNSYFANSHTDATTIYLGAVAGYNSGTISGCDVKATVDLKSDCTGSEIETGLRCGGIVGYNGGTASDNTMSGSVDVSGTATTYIQCGGIIGTNVGTASDNTMSGSVDVSGTATTYIYCGGIVGGNGSTASCSDNTMSGSVDVSGTAGATLRVGGLVGYNNSGAYVYENSLYGTYTCTGSGASGVTLEAIVAGGTTSSTYVYDNYDYTSDTATAAALESATTSTASVVSEEA